jgi:WhiB family transcriptional regulator, redox-sensing transcriptional regulator
LPTILRRRNVVVSFMPLRIPVALVPPPGVVMAEHHRDHQFTGPGPQPVAALAPHRRKARTPAPPAGHASWMLRGACRGEDPELFFPISSAGPSLAQVSSAKAVCARCPVRVNCLTYALIVRPEGIWGGTTREERCPDDETGPRPRSR